MGDLRHTGNPDIVAGCQVQGEVSVLLSIGNGSFHSAVNYPVPAGVDLVTVGDFDGNGTLDVAVTNGAASGMVSVLRARVTVRCRRPSLSAQAAIPSGLQLLISTAMEYWTW